MDYPLAERLRCNYGGRDFSGAELTAKLPTSIMLEAADTIDRLTSELTAAKEEIARLKEQESATEKERRYWYDLAGKANLAITSERKETERLREALTSCLNDFGYFGNGGVSDDTVQQVKAALQSRQGEE